MYPINIYVFVSGNQKKVKCVCTKKFIVIAMYVWNNYEKFLQYMVTMCQLYFCKNFSENEGDIEICNC